MITLISRLINSIDRVTGYHQEISYGTLRDSATSRVKLLERLSMCFRSPFTFLYDVAWNTAARVLQNIVNSSQRRHEICFTIDHFFNTDFIQEYAVFN